MYVKCEVPRIGAAEGGDVVNLASEYSGVNT